MKNGATPFKAYVSFGYDISFEYLYNNFHMTVLYLKFYLKVTLCDTHVNYLFKSLKRFFLLQISVLFDWCLCMYAVHLFKDLQRIYTFLRDICDICYSICYPLRTCDCDGCNFFLLFSFRCLSWFRGALGTL